jgi:TRAP transporter TAXI family solute receptor
MKRITLLLCLWFLVLNAGLTVAQEFGIGTSNPGSVLHSAGMAIAKLANENAGLRATVQPYASPTVFMPAVNAGDPQFGIASVPDVSYAYEGTDYFAGRQYHDLRAVGILFPLRTGIFVRKSSNLVKIADLRGHSMPDGFTSQKIIPPLLDVIYAMGGISRADLKLVPVPNVGGGADAFTSGRVDGFFHSLGSAKVRESDAAVGGIRMLQIEPSAKNLEIFRKKFPGGYFLAEKPGPANPGVLEPMYSTAYDAMVFASAKTSDEAVYRLTRAMYENKSTLVAGFQALALFDPQSMAKSIPVPYHPGAIKFYKEKGMWPPK